MKKLLSVLLALTLIVSALVIPTTVAATTEPQSADVGLGGYYKFTADNIFDYSNHNISDANEITFKGTNFDPFLASNNGSSGWRMNGSVSTPTLTLADGTQKKYIRVQSQGEYTNFYFLNKDGKPFELTPGHTYTMKWKMYNSVSSEWNQAYICGMGVTTNDNVGLKANPNATGFNNQLVANDARTDALTGSQIRLAYAYEINPYNLAVPGGGNSTFYKVADMNNYLADAKGDGTMSVYSGANGELKDIAITSIRKESSTTFTVPDKATYEDRGATVNYDEANDAYSLTVPYGIGSGYTETAGTVSLNNYLYMWINGGKNTYGEGAQDQLVTYDIEYVEIYDNAYTYVNFVDGEGNEIESKQYTKGETISLSIPTAPAGKYFVGWYTDNTFTTLAPVTETANGGNKTYYAKFNDYTDNAEGNFGVNDEYWYGSKFASKTYTRIPYAFTNNGQYNFGVPTGTWLSYTKNTNYTTIYNPNGRALKSSDTSRLCQIANCEICGGTAGPAHDENGITYMHSWNSGMSAFVVNDDGSLFAAKPNTSYKITVKYQVSGNAIQQKSPEYGYNKVEGVSNSTLSFGYGFKTNSAVNGYDVMSNGNINSISFSHRPSSIDIETKTDVITKSAVVTTDDMSGEIPALGIFITLGENGFKLNSAGTAYEYDADNSPRIDLYSITVQEAVAVTYNYGNESVTKDGTAGDELMALPTKSGAVVDGWYTDAACTEKYEGKMAAGLTLYGKWTNESGTFNVKYYDGDTLIKDVDLPNNSILWNAEGYNNQYFGGWYTDKELKNLYTGLNGEVFDLTLYGKFYAYDTDMVITDWNGYTSNDTANVYYNFQGEANDNIYVGGYMYYGNKNGDAFFQSTAKSWGQPGYYIIENPTTGEAFRPQPGATYHVEVDYSTELVSSATGEIRLGWGLVRNASERGNSDMVSAFANESLNGADGDKVNATISADIVVPANFGDNQINCLTVRPNINNKNDGSAYSKVYVHEIRVTKVIPPVIGGAVSKLTDTAVEIAGSQAMRVYYGYALNENGKVEYNGKEYNLIERGILYSPSALPKDMTLANTGKGLEVYSMSKKDNFEQCWSITENGDGSKDVIYSNYFGGFINDWYDKVLSFRGYIIIQNAEETVTIHTDNVETYSIDAITAAIDNQANGVEKEKVTLLLVIGQSNAEGAGYAEENNIAKKYADTYSMSAMPTVAPYGAVYAARKEPVMALTPDYEYGTSWSPAVRDYMPVFGFSPAFAAKWHELTGERVVIIHTAVGATKLAAWQKDANSANYPELTYANGEAGYSTSGYYLYSYTVDNYNKTYEALSQNYEISHSFYIWNQGESERSREGVDSSVATINSDAKYEEYFLKLHNDLLADCKGLQGGTISIVRNADGGENGATFAPRRAQMSLSENYSTISMGTWLSDSLNRKMPNWVSSGVTVDPGLVLTADGRVDGAQFDLVGNAKDCGYNGGSGYGNMHYTQRAYNEIGADAAVNYYNQLNGNATLGNIRIYDSKGTTESHELFVFDANGAVKSGGIITKDDANVGILQIRLETLDGKPTVGYKTALKTDIANSKLVITVYKNSEMPEGTTDGDEYISAYGVVDWTALEGAGVTELDVEVVIK